MIRKYITPKSTLFIMFASLKLVLQSYTRLNGIFMSASLTLFCYIASIVNMVSVTSASRYITPAPRYITSASRYHPRYLRRSSMYIRFLIPRNFTVLSEAAAIVKKNLNAQLLKACRTVFNVVMHLLVMK